MTTSTAEATWLELQLLPEASIAGPPPRKPPLAAAAPPRGGRGRLLVVGESVQSSTVRVLEGSGYVVRRAANISDAIERLAEARYDALLVSPHISSDADGVRFVRSLKFAAREDVPSMFRQVIDRNRKQPVIILPPTGTTEFAVYLDADTWWLRDTSQESVSQAVMSLSPPPFAG